MYQALLSMQSNILSSLFLIGNIFFASLQAQSQPAEPRMSKVDYINEFKDQAIREMHATGIPASITLAQGMLESDYGNSPLAKYARNHFGIKCHKDGMDLLLFKMTMKPMNVLENITPRLIHTAITVSS